MKFKIITLTFLLIIGTNCFSDEIFLSGGFGISPQAHISSFNQMSVKPQAKIGADTSLFINFPDTFSAGISVGIIYTFASEITGGWSYPGFNGIETGLELLYHLPFFPDAGIGAAAAVGWYRYNLTTSLFFLPSFTVFPSWKFISSDHNDFYLELPVSIYLHKQAELFLSSGLRVRMMLK
jgi:hypothetical protein